MANNFNVSGVINLVDNFTAKARSVAASTDLMTSRFDQLRTRADNVRNVLKSVAVAAAAAFSVGKVKDFLSAAAEEDVLMNKFEQMFSRYKQTLQVGRGELNKEIASLARLGGFDEEDIMGNVAAPMMRSGRLAGQNFLRAMQVAVNIGALNGNTGEALRNAGTKLSAMLINPRRGIMAAARDGIFSPQQQRELQKLALDDRNLSTIQNKILEGYEKMYGGAADRTKESAARTLASLSVGIEELNSGIGHLINSAFGSWLRATALEIKAVGSSFADMSATLDKASTSGEKISILLEAFSNGSIKAKLMATAVVALVAAISVSLVGAFVALAGPIGIATTAIIGVVTAMMSFSKEITEAWNKSNILKAAIVGIGGALTAILVPAVKTLLVAFAPFMSGIALIAGLAALVIYWDKVKEAGTAAINALKNLWDSFTGFLISSLDSANAPIKNLWNSFMDSKVVDWVSNLGRSLSDSVNTLLSTAKEFWNSFTDAGTAKIAILSEKIRELWTALMNSSVMDWVKNLGQIFYEALTAPFKAVGGLLSNLNVGEKISSVSNSIMSFIGLGESPKLPAATNGSMPMGVKATSDAKVSGEVNINVKDPAGRTDVSVISKGDVPLNRGQTSGGAYRSTIPSLSAGR